jgi:hypothetical protein
MRFKNILLVFFLLALTASYGLVPHPHPRYLFNFDNLDTA